MLVRNRLEAAQVREALQTLGIPSVYLSNRDSVFETLEAQELLWLLQAVLSPERENTLRSALATSMFGLTALDIENLNQDEQAWDALVEEFSEYRQIWRQRGVMPMLRALMTARHIAENLLATRGGERRLTDILHISELLQEAASQLESEHALVRWLTQHIAEPDSNAANQQMRLESDKHLVQIVTIHKSKGLEYPWSGCRLSPGFANRTRRSITIARRSRRCWIWARMRPASSWRRRNGWRKICACCTSP